MSCLSIKDDSIDPKDLTPQIVLGIMICNDVYKSFGIAMVITSLNDAKHMTNSLHYSGNAVDIRINNIPSGKVQLIEQACRQHLNKHYDFILEHNHFHLEYDHKG